MRSICARAIWYSTVQLGAKNTVQEGTVLCSTVSHVFTSHGTIQYTTMKHIGMYSQHSTAQFDTAIT